MNTKCRKNLKFKLTLKLINFYEFLTENLKLILILIFGRKCRQNSNFKKLTYNTIV